MSDSKPKIWVLNLPNDYLPVSGAETARNGKSVADTSTLAMLGGCNGNG